MVMLMAAAAVVRKTITKVGIAQRTLNWIITLGNTGKVR